MRTTPTRWLTGVLLATALILAACGGSTDETATDPAVDEPASEATAEEGSDVQDDGQDAAGDGSAAGGAFAFEHVAGTTEVPVDPQRIVTLQDQNALLPLLELGCGRSRRQHSTTVMAHTPSGEWRTTTSTALSSSVPTASPTSN